MSRLLFKRTHLVLDNARLNIGRLSTQTGKFDSTEITPVPAVTKPAAVSDARARQQAIFKEHLDDTSSSELARLFEAVSVRSPDRILKELEALRDRGRDHLITDAELELIVRALHKYGQIRSPDDSKRRHLYRRRMGIFRQWLKDGRRAPLSVWFLLLEEARLTKQYKSASQLASQTWEDMRVAGVKPSVHCYNSYMAAICVQPSTFEYARMRKKTDTAETRARREKSIVRAEEKLRKAILLYREMIKDGIEPNAMSVELLVLALGWASNLDSLKSLLRQTWNISVPADLHQTPWEQGVPDEYDEEGVDLEDRADATTNTAKVQLSSGLFPTQKTLMAFALAYGYNCRVQLAVATIRLMARTYAIPISVEVWTELMKYAALDAEHAGGFTPNSYVNELFRTCVDDYGTKPSISMYSILAQHVHRMQCNPDSAFGYMDTMLASVEGDTRMNRPNFHSKKAYPHARAVAIQTLARVRHQQQKRIDAMQRKRERLDDGATDAVRLLEADIKRRSEFLETLSTRWTARVVTFDETMKSLVMAQQEETMKRQAATHERHIPIREKLRGHG